MAGLNHMCIFLAVEDAAGEAVAGFKGPWGRKRALIGSAIEASRRLAEHPWKPARKRLQVACQTLFDSTFSSFSGLFQRLSGAEARLLSRTYQGRNLG
ncbi:hypothetical protein CRV24_007881 [Beauveria bassiana]|nr:hypothetical protein CRV24_007881 [Beauveria bassiana]